MNLEAANVLLGVLGNAVRFYAIKRLIELFLGKNNNCWKYTWVLYVAACCYTSAVYEIFKSPVWNIFSNLTGLLLVTFPYKTKLSRKMFFVFLIYIINGAVDGVIVFSFTRYVTGESFNQIYECITSLVILLITFILEKTVQTERKIELPLFYVMILGAVPAASIACVYYLALTETERRQTVVVVSSLILLVNMIIFYLYNALAQFYSEKIEKQMFEQMVNVYEYQLDIVQKSQEQINALRHDMKHHIIELSSMIKEKENPEAIAYLEDMRKFMLNPQEYVSTGNREIDGILNYLLKDADKTLEHVNINIRMPEKIYEKDFEICVILGNLVDNAIREARKSEEKYLEIDIQTKKGILLIFIENSYSGEVIEQDNQFKTSQKGIAIHGIGLENVKQRVEETGGEIYIDYGNHRFKVKVLLYLTGIK